MDIPSSTSLRIDVNDFILDYSTLRSVGAWKRTLQELPAPLQNRVRPIIALVAKKDVSVFEYILEDRSIRVKGNALDAPVHEYFSSIGANVIQTLELTLWYMHHESRIRDARARQADFNQAYQIAKKRYHNLAREQKKQQHPPVRSMAKWRCLCCGQDVHVNRNWCQNNECPSWTMYYEATGEVVLQEVKSESA